MLSAARFACASFFALGRRDDAAPALAPSHWPALAHGIGAVLGQVSVDAKSNEIPAVRELLKAFADLTGAVVTTDALHAQHDTARAVPHRRADYAMTVKANTPTLQAQLKKLPWKNFPGFSHVAKDHGRRTRRTVKVVPAPARAEFDGAAQVAQVRRTVTRKGKQDRRGRLRHHQRRRRGHPRRLDPGAPAHREQAPLGPRRHLPAGQLPGQDRKRAPLTASLRNLAISMLRPDRHANTASANRHHARDPRRTLMLLQSA